MKKIIASFIILSVAYNICAQQIFFTPIIGGKFNISRIPFYVKNFDIPDYNIINEKTIWISPMETILFGGRFEYQKNKHNFSLGFIYNDQAYSKFRYSFYALQNGENTLIEKTVYEGVKLSKIPLSYNYTWFGNKKNSFEFKFHVGCNLLITEKWNSGFLLLDQQSYTLTQDPVTGNNLAVTTLLFSGNNFQQDRLHITFDLGFNLSFKLNEKRSIITSFYFEKGFLKYPVSASQLQFDYNNGQTIYSLGNGSSGTSLHFKILLPLLIKDYSK